MGSESPLCCLALGRSLLASGLDVAEATLIPLLHSAFLSSLLGSFMHSLAQVPHEMVAQSRDSYLEAEIHAPSLEDLGAQLAESGATFHTYLEHLVQGLQKEAKEKFKGWVTCSSPDNTDLAFKKVRFPLLQNVC